MGMPAQLMVGQVMHRRLRPVINSFTYPVFYVQLPLRELNATGGAFFSIDHFNLLSFYQKDHGPRDGTALLPWIQSLLRQQGLPTDGEIILQTFPRVLGYVFNPVSFWFCHNGAGELIAVLAEVNNTFGGTHSYLLHHPEGGPMQNGQVWAASKAFHVSPFCTIEGGYRFRFYMGAENSVMRIDYDDAQGELLLTAISGKNKPWSNAALLAAFLRMPYLTIGIMARIHWQAVKLIIKRVRFIGMNPPTPQPTQEKPGE